MKNDDYSLYCGELCRHSGVGIPLGNLTSQLFANVYLHELDWHVKQTLSVQHYVRYCDDFVMLIPSREKDRTSRKGRYVSSDSSQCTVTPECPCTNLEAGS